MTTDLHCWPVIAGVLAATAGVLGKVASLASTTTQRASCYAGLLAVCTSQSARHQSHNCPTPSATWRWRLALSEGCVPHRCCAPPSSPSPPTSSPRYRMPPSRTTSITKTGCSQLVAVWRRPVPSMGHGSHVPGCRPVPRACSHTTTHPHTWSQSRPPQTRGPAAAHHTERPLSTDAMHEFADVRNVCMVVSYDGTRFKGFQLQVCHTAHGLEAQPLLGFDRHHPAATGSSAGQRHQGTTHVTQTRVCRPHRFGRACHGTGRQLPHASLGPVVAVAVQSAQRTAARVDTRAARRRRAIKLPRSVRGSCADTMDVMVVRSGTPPRNADHVQCRLSAVGKTYCYHVYPGPDHSPFLHRYRMGLRMGSRDILDVHAVRCVKQCSRAYTVVYARCVSPVYPLCIPYARCVSPVYPLCIPYARCVSSMLGVYPSTHPTDTWHRCSPGHTTLPNSPTSAPPSASPRKPSTALTSSTVAPTWASSFGSRATDSCTSRCGTWWAPRLPWDWAAWTRPRWRSCWQWGHRGPWDTVPGCGRWQRRAGWCLRVSSTQPRWGCRRRSPPFPFRLAEPRWQQGRGPVGDDMHQPPNDDCVHLVCYK